MPNVAQVIGGAGTGKTTHLLQLMEKVIERGTDPKNIGFVTFTKAARREAAQRAAKLFGLSISDLEQDGYFRTLHSTCYMLLGVSSKEILADDKSSRDWIANALGEQIADSSDLGGAEPFQERSDSEIALGLWHCSRNRLEPFKLIWDKARYTDWNTPDFEYCKKIIEHYEQHKRLDGRCDFTDLLGRYAGYKFTFQGPVTRTPEGDVPQIDAWFLDECQDNSALSDAVARRVVERSKWVYLVGDPFQAIYGWAGADAKHFMNWPVQDGKKMVLQQTYRCPAPVVSLGEEILSDCSDYWNRGIKAASHDGDVDYLNYRSSWLDNLDPRESWLIVTRTNFHAARIAKRLDAANIPWRNTGKGNNKWNAPVRHKTILALRALENNQPISDEEWKLILKNIKNQNGKEYFLRGTKKEWQDKNISGTLNNLDGIHEWGATDDFTNMIKRKSWRRLVTNSQDYLDALNLWGHEATENSGIRVGTIHSVKGSEADNVVLLTTTSEQITKSQEDASGYDEERRVEYVAVTRARKNLFICKEKRPKNAMLKDVA